MKEKIEHTLQTALTLATQLKMSYLQMVHISKEREYLDKKVPNLNNTQHGLTVNVMSTINNFMLIQSESLLEEYNKHLTVKKFPEHAERIRSFKKDASVIMSYFKKWDNTREYRNNLLAHNLRLKDGASIFNLKTKKGYNTPHYNNDYSIVYYLHRMLAELLGKHFKEVFQLNTSDRILDRIEYTGEFKSLKESLPELIEITAELGLHVTAEDMLTHLQYIRSSDKP